MRMALNPRAARWFGRLPPAAARGLPRPSGYAALEATLLVLIAVQAARLAWIMVTPLGPLGDWKAAAPAGAQAADPAVLAEFDPFFRLAAAEPATVTALNLRLHGVREDRATGRGSAIIGLPDGSQRSFAIGEEIMPGVTLRQVGFDHVIISRGGVPEQIFLDQSGSLPVSTAAPATISTPPPRQAPPADVQMTPVPVAPPAPPPPPPPGDAPANDARMLS